jgi:hypothetical protein
MRGPSATCGGDYEYMGNIAAGSDRNRRNLLVYKKEISVQVMPWCRLLTHRYCLNARAGTPP